MYDVVGLSILVVVILVFAALAVWSWRARRGWVKLTGGIPTTLLAVLGIVVLVLAVRGFMRIDRTYSNPVANVTVASSPERIATGEKFARVCTGCHSSNGQLPLGGQAFFGGAGGPPFGTLWAPNLTPTHLGTWSDGEIIRAIREGVGKDGRSLVIMPSEAFHGLSDDDVQSLVAYLRSQPAIQPDSPGKALNILAALTIASSDAAYTAQSPISGPVTAPPVGATPQYGDYLTRVVGCRSCHGANLQGAIPPGSDTGVMSPNLVDFAKNVSADQFISTLRTGKTPTGYVLNPEEMPWRDFEKFSDDDFRAIYSYLTAPQ